MIVDDLIDKGTDLYYEDLDKAKDLRFKAIKESLNHQFKNCALYRKFCKQKEFDPRRDLKNYADVKDIPYLTTANFKRSKGKPKELLCVPEDDILFWALSSGTSGDPSMVGRSKLQMERFMKGFWTVLEDQVGLKDYNWSLFFTPPLPHIPIEQKVPKPSSHFMRMFEMAITCPVENRVWALKVNEGEISAAKRFELDVPTTLGFLQSNPGEKGQGWIGGSIPLLYGALSKLYAKTGKPFNVGENTKIAVGGGWKSFTGEKVEPEKFRKDLSKILGIPITSIIDGYQFTETDVVIAECKHFNKHIPPWADVIVRDVDTLEPVEDGEKGLLNIINPAAHSYAGVSILQDDMVRVVMEDGCECGRKGKVIEILGRAKGAEAKGCGAQIAEMTDE
ncbi:MAG: hypothetical protein GF364_01890 [Candidatus Lokiarchaeota archaeon]|nr:hypothetical protein [Candidatus Lokiarchaeota archaeon]